MESNFQNIIIRIKTLDNSLYDLKIPKDISVSDLKAKIEKVPRKIFFLNHYFQ